LNVTAKDHPEINCRVFRLKQLDMIDVIVKKEIFGTVLTYVQTIEFQKRGLLHAVRASLNRFAISRKWARIRIHCIDIKHHSKTFMNYN